MACTGRSGGLGPYRSPSSHLRPDTALMKSMGQRHWARAWAHTVVGVLKSSRHLGRHCRVQHPQLAANSGQFSPPCIIHIWTVHHPNVQRGTTMAIPGLLEGPWNKPKPHVDLFFEGYAWSAILLTR